MSLEVIEEGKPEDRGDDPYIVERVLQELAQEGNEEAQRLLDDDPRGNIHQVDDLPF